MHIDEFFAEHPDAYEISSDRKSCRMVSGQYDDDGYPTADATFCKQCGNEIECLDCENEDCNYSPLYVQGDE